MTLSSLNIRHEYWLALKMGKSYTVGPSYQEWLSSYMNSWDANNSYLFSWCPYYSHSALFNWMWLNNMRTNNIPIPMMPNIIDAQNSNKGSGPPNNDNARNLVSLQIVFTSHLNTFESHTLQSVLLAPWCHSHSIEVAIHLLQVYQP